jgi:acetyl-CoA carboxylase carboxyl transferase subunit beta
MSLRSWFDSRRKANKQGLNPDSITDRVSDEDLERLWTQCYHCNQGFPTKQVEDNLQVCPNCNYHFRIGSAERILQLCDQFEELDSGLTPQDPLQFFDNEPYPDKVKKAAQKSGLKEAITTGIATVHLTREDSELSVHYALAVMDFAYLGGSMGSVVGEKITRLIEEAIQKRLAVVIVSSSGGARMQEGTFSLMQMVKTGSALGQLHEEGLLYLSVLTEPTFGGVTASFGTLGDIIIAEQGARIGFAGRRVIEQTIRQKLPADFQTAEYLLQYGQVDRVTHRHQLKTDIAELIGLHQKAIDRAGDYRQRQHVVSV